jgi:LysM repeat protein
MRPFTLILAIFYIVFPLQARPQAGVYTQPELDELRIEIDDLKHALKATQVDLGILDERQKSMNKGQAQNKEENTLSHLSATVNALEKKVSLFEKTLEKAAQDLRCLNTASTQAFNKMQELEQSLLSHANRLDEVTKLKETLSTISNAIRDRPTNETTPSTKTYRVKAGDSLEKIARCHHTSADTIRKINHLSHDKIIVGQELRLPDGTP